MQTAGYFISPAAKFAAGMQDSQDDFNCRDALLGMNSHWDTTAVVNDCDGIIRIDVNDDFCTVAGQRLVNRVVYDLVNKMV